MTMTFDSLYEIWYDIPTDQLVEVTVALMFVPSVKTPDLVQFHFREGAAQYRMDSRRIKNIFGKEGICLHSEKGRATIDFGGTYGIKEKSIEKTKCKQKRQAS
jgi:hypothetical protein